VSRWFRFYDDALNDPKVQRLDPKLFKSWVNLLCLASKSDGWLPPIDDVSFALRLSESEVGKIVDALISLNLIDEIDGRFCPHNWQERQYSSDSSAERMKRHRDRKKQKGDVASDVTVTPQNRTETDTETEQKDAEANASGADAPIDHRKRLFSEGLAKLSALTGKGPDACRSFVGKCLKAASDDAVTVLGLIEEAERNQVVDPSAWIAARLKPVEIRSGKPTSGIIQAADDLRRKIASFDGPAGPNIAVRDGPGPAPPRLLSNG
jgi:hypothetical protein